MHIILNLMWYSFPDATWETKLQLLLRSQEYVHLPLFHHPFYWLQGKRLMLICDLWS